eukprot:466604_1
MSDFEFTVDGDQDNKEHVENFEADETDGVTYDYDSTSRQLIKWILQKVFRASPTSDKNLLFTGEMRQLIRLFEHSALDEMTDTAVRSLFARAVSVPESRITVQLWDGLASLVSQHTLVPRPFVLSVKTRDLPTEDRDKLLDVIERRVESENQAAVLIGGQRMVDAHGVIRWIANQFSISDEKRESVLEATATVKKTPRLTRKRKIAAISPIEPTAVRNLGRPTAIRRTYVTQDHAKPEMVTLPRHLVSQLVQLLANVAPYL